jgi:hypothetical protein
MFGAGLPVKNEMFRVLAELRNPFPRSANTLKQEDFRLVEGSSNRFEQYRLDSRLKLFITLSELSERFPLLIDIENFHDAVHDVEEELGFCPFGMFVSVHTGGAVEGSNEL